LDYLILRKLHIALAGLSIAGFVLRWIWVMSRSRLSESTLTKILPHVIDTALLAAGVLLAINIGQYPGQSGWLTAKIAGLLLYIMFGTIAMRLATKQLPRISAFLCAVTTFAWIVSVARLKSPWGFLGLIG
jgi:uncharacterized membrane protein SirB2